MKDKNLPDKKQFIYPDLIFNGIILFYLIMGLLVTLALIRPFGLGDLADPLRSPDIVKPEWYFLAFFQFINYLPKGVGTGIVFLGIFLFCLWPLLPGVKQAGGKMKISFFRIVGVLFILCYLLLTLIGYVAETERTVFGKKYHFDSKGIPHKLAGDKAGASDGKVKSDQAREKTREEPKR